jgi:cellulose synthase/poly-beta-1,6-N-acetylglucosamine synthase-like glycosyltransferase
LGLGQYLSGWALVGLQAAFAWSANRNYLALPELGVEPFYAGDGADHGHVTIVVPARNEGSRLPELLVSLNALTYPNRDVVVVNDGSSDLTASVAENHGARVIHVSGPPAGWTGKSFACQVGADASIGEWLLFTDADTIHGLDSLTRALDTAVRTGSGLMSLLPRQRCSSFWERVLLPYAYALYFAGAQRINRCGGPAIANGQYMLFRRQTYRTVGGHAAVRESIIEDVSLARLVARAGEPVVLARAESCFQVRMYHDLRTLWEGFVKNALRFVSVSPRTGIPTVVATVAFSSALPVALRLHPRLMRLCLLGVPAVGLTPWVRRFGVPLYYAFLYPLAAAVFQIIALDSVRRSVLRRGTVWKGRVY